MVFDPRAFTEAASLQIQGDPRFRAISEGLRSGLEMAAIPRESQAQDLRNQILGEQLKQAQALTPMKTLEAQQAQMLFNRMKEAMQRGRAPQAQQQGQQGLAQSLMQSYQSPNFDTSALNQTVGQQQALPSSFREQRQPYEAGNPYTQVVRQAHPGMEFVDDLFYGDPLTRQFMEKQGYKEKLTTHQDPSSGQVFQSIEYPSGKIEQRVYKVGDRPEEIVKRKEKAKVGVQYGERLADAYDGLVDNKVNIENAIDMINKNPNARNAIGPWNSVVTKYFGNERDQDLLGQLATNSGDILLNVAKNLKGAWTGRDNAMVKEIKFNNNDPFNVYVGKLKAMAVLNQYSRDKTELLSKLIEDGNNRIDAQKEVAKRIKLEPVKKQIDELIKPASPKGSRAAQVDLKSYSDAELERIAGGG